MGKRGLNMSLAKPLVWTAALIGLLQGLAWTIFSVLSICCHTGAITMDVNIANTTGTDYVKYIYVIFLNRNTEGSETVNPKEFFIFMWFYLVFSILWFFISATVIWAMIHEQWHLMKYIFGSWSTITVLISIVDVVLCSLIAVDYKKYNELQQLNGILVTYGIVMTLAARGYILWLINVIFAVVMAIFVFEIVQDEKNDTTGPIIDGYDTANSNPPWYGPAEQTDGLDQSPCVFNGDLTPQARKENEYVDLYNTPYTPNGNPQPPEEALQTPFAAAVANRVATIGKSRGLSVPPNSVAVPVIPPPDYTPPGSPTSLRPVLRSTSKY